MKREGKGKVVPVNEMKAYGGVEEQRQALLTSTPDEGGWSA
jgi:hypothetical protein